jgi:exportin-7
LLTKASTQPAMTPVQLQQLESLTEKAYTAQTQAERAHAEEALKIFSTPEYLPQCRFILDNSHSDYALLFAASNMMKILTNAWNSFSVADRIDVHILVRILFGVLFR